MTSTTLLASGVDARSFVYPLAALAEKLGWDFERQQKASALAAKRLAMARENLQTLQNEWAVATAALAQGQKARLHPQAYQTQMRFLVTHRARMQDAQDQCNSAAGEHEAQRRKLLALQVRLEGLARHREDTFADFARDLRRRQAAAVDQDWLARTHLLGVRT